MADGDKKSPDKQRISEKQRFSFIGFEVFPGKPKDLFKNAAEKEKYEKVLAAKRDKGEVIREDCKLLESRISMPERIVLAVSSIAILLALLLPWYSAYKEVTTEKEVVVEEAAVAPVDSLLADSALVAQAEGDTLALAAVTDNPTDDEAVAEVAATEAAADDGGPKVQSHAGRTSREEIITGHQIRKQKERVYTTLTGFGTFIALGDVGGGIFGSGFVLVVSGILMLLYGLLCIGLPVLNLYGLFGLKGEPDDVAVKLKKLLRLNWLPLVLFVAVAFLSFFGADYGFATEEAFKSFGDSYGPGVLLGSLSWGVFVAMAGSVLVAVKGIEI